MGKKRTHLFVAPQRSPFGEMLLGMRIADALHARGDEIAVFAHDSLAMLVRERPYRLVTLGTGATGVADSIVAVAAEVAADDVILLDATAVYMVLQQEKSDARFLRDVGRKVIGLDVWHLRRTGLRWDLVGAPWQHSKYSLDVTRRLIPVPFAPPVGAKGLYDALPDAVTLPEAERETMRGDLGVGEGERLVFFASAHWQNPESQRTAAGKELATAFPRLMASRVAELGPRVHLVHVGPVRYDIEDLLGERYTWLPQRSPARFQRLLAAADLFLSFNFSATTIGTAFAAGVPVFLGTNSQEGTELPPFRVCPLGLSSFLKPLTSNNPYTDAMVIAEVLEPQAFCSELERLLFDDGVRAALQKRQATYCATVRALPRATDLVDAYLA